MYFEDQEGIDYFLDENFPGKEVWASSLNLPDYHFTEYFATYYGPILLVVMENYSCADGCGNTHYPQMLLAKRQLEKIFALTQ